MSQKRVLRILGAGAVLALLAALSLPVGIGALLATRAGTRPQDRDLRTTPFDHGRSFRTVFLDTRDGVRVAAWLIRAAGPGDCAVVLSHGLFRSRREVLDRAAWLSGAGCEVVTPDLRKHGGTVGGSTTLGDRERYDVLAAHDFLAREFPRSRRFLMGVSMGGAASVAAASLAAPPPAGVVADSTFRNAPNVMDQYARVFFGLPSFPATNLARLGMRLAGGHSPSAFDVEALSRELGERGIPILVLAGTEDRRAPIAEQEAIFRANSSARSRFLPVAGAAHGRPCFAAPVRCRAALADFLDLATQ